VVALESTVEPARTRPSRAQRAAEDEAAQSRPRLREKALRDLACDERLRR